MRIVVHYDRASQQKHKCRMKMGPSTHSPHDLDQNYVISVVSGLVVWVIQNGPRTNEVWQLEECLRNQSLVFMRRKFPALRKTLFQIFGRTRYKHKNKELKKIFTLHRQCTSN